MPEQTSQTLQIAIGRLTKASFATNTFNSRIFYRSLYVHSTFVVDVHSEVVASNGRAPR